CLALGNQLRQPNVVDVTAQVARLDVPMPPAWRQQQQRDRSDTPAVRAQKRPQSAHRARLDARLGFHSIYLFGKDLQLRHSTISSTVPALLLPFRSVSPTARFPHTSFRVCDAQPSHCPCCPRCGALAVPPQVRAALAITVGAGIRLTIPRPHPSPFLPRAPAFARAAPFNSPPTPRSAGRSTAQQVAPPRWA